MADICVLYSRQNEPSAEQLVSQLSKFWDVWWDDKIVGSFRTAIESEIPKSKCVVPIWSSDSRESANVLDEVSLARHHDIPIIPIRIDDCRPPYGYGDLSHVDMKDWNGEPEHRGYLKLVRRVNSVIPPSVKVGRPPRLIDTNLPLPALFLSISSHETQLTPLEALKVLRVFNSSTTLISAYDLLPGRRPFGLIKELTAFRKQGGKVLIDSGNYESTRLNDESWDIQSFHKSLKRIPHDMVFCFDVMNPSANSRRAANEVLAAVERDSAHTTSPVYPIIHAPMRRRAGYDLDKLLEVLTLVADESRPALIAIPERELGAGLMQRIRTMRRLREGLNSLAFYQPVHLLGTGNPWSIATLLAAGADSFDGLEWCRMSIDAAMDRVHHFQHFDFFAFQAQNAFSPITRAALDDPHVDFAGKVAFHNLDYYMDFLKRARDALSEGNLKALVTEIIGKENARQLADEIPGLFK